MPLSCATSIDVKNVATRYSFTAPNKSCYLLVILGLYYMLSGSLYAVLGCALHRCIIAEWMPSNTCPEAAKFPESRI